MSERLRKSSFTGVANIFLTHALFEMWCKPGCSYHSIAVGATSLLYVGTVLMDSKEVKP